MAKIKYEKYKEKFLITEFTNDNGNALEISFPELKRGTITVGEKSFIVENGKLSIPLSKLREKSYTPILKTDTDTCLCDKIKILAGKISLDFPQIERLLYLSSEVISMHRELEEIKRSTKGLCESVYGKNIF